MVARNRNLTGIPEFLREFITTPDPEDDYYFVPEACRLSLFAEGLAYGVIQWNDGDRNSTVIYDADIWGERADKLAPRNEDDETDQPKGGVDAYMHHRLDTSYIESRPNLGWFLTVLDRSGKSAYGIARRLAATE